MSWPAWFEAAPVALLGLFIGSFLNVVIHRLPKMLEAQWADECAQLNAQEGQQAPDRPVFNLMQPRSRCPHCGHVIRWYENVPVVSYAVLGGKCSYCKAAISPRYPAVELLTGALFAFCAYRWGWSWTTLAWCTFCAALVSLTFIDWDTTLLPDDITLPLVWLGLIVAALGLNRTVSLPQAVWGAVVGYLSLWSVYWVFKLITHKEGMGYGDFKLFAALGAWFGWQALMPLILLSSVIGVVVGITLKLQSRLREGNAYLPFGPFLAGAGFVGLLFEPNSILYVAHWLVGSIWRIVGW
jgi:leader peptidase (prepilin peptidase) / N-methyltransferase